MSGTITDLLTLRIDDLATRVAAVVGAAVTERLGIDHDVFVRGSDHADFQADLALGLAKKLGRPPRDIATDIAAGIDPASGLSVEVSGPGFLNITVSETVMVTAIADQLASRSMGVGLAREVGTIVVDYSAPNVAKEMHVGHLRSTVIGDSLVRMLEAAGHRVIRQNHVGDWGTPFGMLIEHLLDLEADGAPVTTEISDLNGFYRAAKAKFDADEAFAERARARVVKLQALDEATLVKWRLIVDTSAHYFQKVYDRLGVRLTLADVAGESTYNPYLASVCEELEGRGQARMDDGALCAFPDGFTNRDGNPQPLILRKSDGGFGYATSDVAAIRYRMQDLGAQYAVYVVGAPQRQHFEMLFEVAREAGWTDETRGATFVPFGSILGADGKMFKTRSGDTVRLEELLQEAQDRARDLVVERNPDLPEGALDDLARSVGIAAVKFADLRNQRTKDYVFDLDSMVKVEGDTGPYLQYTHARARNVLARLGAVPSEAPVEVALGDHERELVLALADHPRSVQGSITEMAPHVLANQLIRIARSFNTVYAESRMVGVEDSPERSTRIFLTLAVAETLAHGLGLLGIDAPTRV